MNLSVAITSGSVICSQVTQSRPTEAWPLRSVGVPGRLRSQYAKPQRRSDLLCCVLRCGQVIAVIGDGAITGGMAYEAMNHAGFLDSNMIVILNDNQQVC